MCRRFAGLIAVLGLLVPSPASASRRSFRLGPIRDVSATCRNQNAEVEQAVDQKLGNVYEEWIGCRGIGFARSTNGGRSFGRPISLPGTRLRVWDPSVAVAPDGTVYAAFIRGTRTRIYPVVVASFDHGSTFPQVTALRPPRKHNWGDRPFIAVGPDGTVYVTWDYGPNVSSLKLKCSRGGSCGFARGQLNEVLQTSRDHGRTFGPMSHVSPGFPAGGAISGPLLVEPSGRIDVLYLAHRVVNRRTDALGPGYNYFTSSSDGGRTWSSPLKLGARVGAVSLAEWWIDGAISMDAGGNLYATWDTQRRGRHGRRTDVGWLTYSTDHGRHWSAPIQAPSDKRNVPHLIEVVGGGAGSAFVGWLSDSNSRGYAQYVRQFSIAGGWLTAPVVVSRQFGNPAVWPGDTFGISALSPGRLVLSWGSAVRPRRRTSEILAARVTAPGF